jgi:hypothetical protein
MQQDTSYQGAEIAPLKVELDDAVKGLLQKASEGMCCGLICSHQITAPDMASVQTLAQTKFPVSVISKYGFPLPKFQLTCDIGRFTISVGYCMEVHPLTGVATVIRSDEPGLVATIRPMLKPDGMFLVYSLPEMAAIYNVLHKNFKEREGSA